MPVVRAIRCSFPTSNRSLPKWLGALQAGGVIWYIFQKPVSTSCIKNNKITERPSQTFKIYWTLAYSYSTTLQPSVIAVIATYQLLVSNHGMHNSANYEIYLLLLISKAKSDSLFYLGTTSLPLSFIMKNSDAFQVSCNTKKICFWNCILLQPCSPFLKIFIKKLLRALIIRKLLIVFSLVVLVFSFSWINIFAEKTKF